MEMEHINENTIRVVIRSDDLAARGVTFLDLLGSQRDIENFFYSILEEVDIEEEFQGSESVVFQVMPKGDGIELFISKNPHGEDLNSFEAGENFKNDIAEYLKNQFGTVNEEEAEVEPETFSKLANMYVFEFYDFEDLIQMAQELDLEAVWTNVYSFEEQYFLQLTFLEEELVLETQETTLARILEFADFSTVTPEFLTEYGHLIMERTALEQLRHYFK
ncbi:adapter protein MecA 1/2 [Enterococcus sp. PF1-24]|uniref:adaptor protein MecA n=1 Tax=unclassified Enterococcus TaxID=2608891 RepID=UPI0024734333|nr:MULTISPECIES: adaptor protein MecA [unclassified Enterococcus]MDH6363846.1 adapter protein MecA 1/2 [Enterococcus sp. PFB1-1]MDH6400968.1 adapter protein MecA 1/2 [Enterococcus sp. PF1-24]